MDQDDSSQDQRHPLMDILLGLGERTAPSSPSATQHTQNIWWLNAQMSVLLGLPVPPPPFAEGSVIVDVEPSEEGGVREETGRGARGLITLPLLPEARGGAAQGGQGEETHELAEAACPGEIEHEVRAAAAEDEELSWRIAAFRAQVPQQGTIIFSPVRPLPAESDQGAAGGCHLCGDPLSAEDEPASMRCVLCVIAIEIVLRGEEL